MIIDEPQVNAEIRQYATQWNLVPEDIRKELESNWNGDQSDEFYRGLLAGLSVPTAILQQQPEMINMVPYMVAFVANELVKKEIFNPEG